MKMIKTKTIFISRSFIILLLIFGWITIGNMAWAKISPFTPGNLILNIGKTKDFPYPLAFIYTPSTDNSMPESDCEKLFLSNTKDNSKNNYFVCLKSSLLPKNPQPFQFITTKGFMITSIQGYDTYKACTTAHHDGSCYRWYIVNTPEQMLSILDVYIKKYIKPLPKIPIIVWVTLLPNTGETAYLKHPTVFISNIKNSEIFMQIFGSKTKHDCQQFHEKHPLNTIKCLKLSLLPKHSKKFQFLAIDGVMITAAHGYNTYRECTAHHKQSCYRLYIVDSEQQVTQIKNRYKKNFKVTRENPNILIKIKLISNSGETNYLPYPMAFMKSIQWVQLKIQQEHDDLLTESNCQLDNEIYSDSNKSVNCLKLSLLPKHPKKFQSLTITGYMITAMHGYDTYKECTTAHNDGSCYRLYIVGSKIQKKNIETTYKQKYKKKDDY